MSLGEKLLLWAVVIAFALLAFVTGLAAMLIVATGQSGNSGLLTLVAIGSAGIAFAIRRKLKSGT